MRTTLDIDEDVLLAAKGLANSRRTTAGKVISELARQGLQPQVRGKRVRTKNGVPLFSFRPGTKPITMELINQLRDEDP